MTEDEARVQLERMVAHTSEPQLDSDDIDALLNFCQTDDTGWALEAGAAEGWRWKAGRMADKHDVQMIDGSRVNEREIYLNCRQQAEFYEGKAGSFVMLALRSAYTTDDVVTVPDPDAP